MSMPDASGAGMADATADCTAASMSACVTLGLSASALARALCVPASRITAILKLRRGVTADTALRLSRYFGTTPRMWLNLQTAFELRLAEIRSGMDITERVHPREPGQVSCDGQRAGTATAAGREAPGWKGCAARP